jgi:hypothetical protein
MSFLISYITLKSIYNFYPPCFKKPYRLFARILLLQQLTTPPEVIVKKIVDYPVSTGFCSIVMFKFPF